MSSIISFLDSSVCVVGESIETACKELKYLPQYKYLTVPVYKACVQRIGPVAATAVSFLSADLICHQLLPSVCVCLLRSVEVDWNPLLGQRGSCVFSYNFYPPLILTAFAIPVMYVKYKRINAELYDNASCI